MRRIRSVRSGGCGTMLVAFPAKWFRRTSAVCEGVISHTLISRINSFYNVVARNHLFADFNATVFFQKKSSVFGILRDVTRLRHIISVAMVVVDPFWNANSISKAPSQSTIFEQQFFRSTFSPVRVAFRLHRVIGLAKWVYDCIVLMLLEWNKPVSCLGIYLYILIYLNEKMGNFTSYSCKYTILVFVMVS